MKQATPLKRRQFPRLRSRHALFAVLALSTGSAAFLAVAQEQGAAAAQPAASTASTTRNVRVIRAADETLSVTRSASATINPLQDSQVSAGASGQVDAIFVQSGAKVAAGEPVIQLDNSNLKLQRDNAALALQSARINLSSAENASGSANAQSSAALQAAQISMDLAEKQYREAQQLFAAGAVSRNQLTQLEAGLEQAKAGLIQAEAALDKSARAPSEDLELLRLQVQQAETQLAQAEQALSDSTITAPYNGEVAEVLIQEGEFIGAGSPAFRLIGTDKQIATFSVPPEDAGYLLQHPEIWLPYNGNDYGAHVLRASQTATSRLQTVEAELYASKQRVPNGTVTQFDYTLKIASGVTLPSDALRSKGSRYSVFVAAKGVAKEVTVSLVNEADNKVVVSGIDPGAEVIYPLPADLSPNSSIRILGN